MGAKAPKITPAQRELEALQLRTLQEQARERNEDGFNQFTLRRRMLLGTLGMNLFAEPGAALPTAQREGGILSPSLTDPATVAAERATRLSNIAGAFNPEAAETMRSLLTITRRI